MSDTGRTEAVLDELRLAVLRGFATTGRAPSVAALVRDLGMATQEVQAGLEDLAQRRHVVLDVYGSVVMAHPFASVPLGFSVMGRSTLWWGGCAWDSFALPNLLPEEGEVLVATRCPACDRPHAWNVGPEHAPAGSQVAHFLVPVQRLWEDVVHSCRNQRIFCDERCVAEWLARTEQERGYVMDLTTLWNLAAHWYEGRLAPGYQRREPDDAADYLRGVGLVGPFWGG